MTSTTSPRRLRALVVDDEPSILDAFRRALRREFQVDVALGSTRAFELLARKEFDVLFVDYAMPGLDGITLLGRVAELRPEMDRFLVTAHSDAPEVREAQERGLARVIGKPWARSDLLSALALRGARPR